MEPLPESTQLPTPRVVGQLTIAESRTITGRRALVASLRAEGQTLIAAADALEGSVQEYAALLSYQRNLASVTAIDDDGQIWGEVAP